MTRQVSFVICTHNGSTRLPRVLAALASEIHAAGALWEVIVVDNGSTDASGSLAQDIWSSTGSAAPMKVVLETRIGLVWARLRGVKEAGGSVICFIDDDNIIVGDWVELLTRRFKDMPELGVLGAHGVAETVDGLPLPRWFEAFQHCYAVGHQGHHGLLPRSALHVYGAGLAIRREVILAITGSELMFHFAGHSGPSVAGGDDSEICCYALCLGWRLGYDTRLKFSHLIPRQRLTRTYLAKLGARDAAVGFHVTTLALAAGLKPPISARRLVNLFTAGRVLVSTALAALHYRSAMPLAYGASFSLTNTKFAFAWPTTVRRLERVFQSNHRHLLRWQRELDSQPAPMAASLQTVGSRR